MATLYIVSTPIGNLKDITLRALEILKSVDVILAEDTRKTRQLLSKYSISKPLESFYEHNEQEKTQSVLRKLQTGQTIALVSDAGTPLISDPGYKLVRECLKLNIKVESIPGPSSVLTALTSSGLPTDQFLFIGYLPKKSSKSAEILRFIETVLENRPTTIILFESPYRVQKTLEIIAEKFPDRDLVVAREMTKIHEEFIRSKARDITKKKIVKKGEFTILLH